MTKESHGEKTRRKILEAGIEIWPDITLSKVGRAANLTHAAISYHFPTNELRDHIAEYAVKTGVSRVIVQLITEDHPAVANLSEGERSAHFFAV